MQQSRVFTNPASNKFLNAAIINYFHPQSGFYTLISLEEITRVNYFKVITE